MFTAMEQDEFLLVPTRVGMILNTGGINEMKKACPHTRGDDPLDELLEEGDFDLSPHAWG